MRPGYRAQPPDPEGTSPVGPPCRISRWITPPLRGLKGGIQARSIEDVTRMIALICVEICGDGSFPSEAHGGGWAGLSLDEKEPSL